MTNEDLSDCAGYRVEAREARLGTVTAVVPRTGRDERGVLIVHSGLLSCRLSAVPFDEVESVDVGQGHRAPGRARNGATRTLVDVRHRLAGRT